MDDRLTIAEVTNQINELCSENGYIQTLIAVGPRGDRFAITQVLPIGFHPELILMKINDNDAEHQHSRQPGIG